jgi:hypothetical protein
MAYAGMTPAPETDSWWKEPAKLEWARWLLDSFHRWTGRELVGRVGRAVEQAETLYVAPFVVVSHGTEADPILNYGNRAALQLWETTWEAFRRIPSRLTAEPVNQAERQRMLEQALSKGYLDDYRGVRISTTGRRFLVEDALVWSVVDADGQRLGQAATFSHWRYLD